MRRHIVIDEAEFAAPKRAAGPPTADHLANTTDGRRLDSKEAVVAFFAELAAERAAAAEAPMAGGDEPS
ncbi:MAG: hypothetical protein ACT4OS_02005 [Acidimicrobiales bacterium]